MLLIDCSPERTTPSKGGSSTATSSVSRIHRSCETLAVRIGPRDVEEEVQPASQPAGYLNNLSRVWAILSKGEIASREEVPLW